MLDEDVAGHSREALQELQTVAATIPAAPVVNPLEDMVREMLRPILKQWLDEHLPQMVDEHVKREISRITGRSSKHHPGLCRDRRIVIFSVRPAGSPGSAG